MRAHLVAGHIDGTEWPPPRWFRVVVSTLVVGILVLAGKAGSTIANAAQPSDASVTVGGLRIDNRTDQPLGVDDANPLFSWELSGSGAAAQQAAYEVRVTDRSGLQWDSGRVSGAAQQAAYAGAALTSRMPASWQVRVWDRDGAASNWSKPSTFEMGLLQPSDWGAAQWVQLPPPPLNRGVVIEVGDQSARYMRLDVTKLGLPLYESSYGTVSRIQLSEMEVLAPDGTNEALGASVSASDQFNSQGWSTKGLTDGLIVSPGFMSRQSASQDVNPSKWVQLDLKSVQHFNRVVLFPRSDARTPDGLIPNFPVDFTIKTSASSPSVLSTIKTVTGEPNPPGPDPSNPLPIFARPFTTAKPVSSARLYVAGLGADTATVNGAPVTDTVLNPGVTNPLRSVEYGDYDITHLLRTGSNVLGVALGNGQTDVYPQGNTSVGRTDVYEKFNSVPPPDVALAAPAQAGDTTIAVTGTRGMNVGDTVNVDTGDGGARLESRRITAIGPGSVTVSSALDTAHAAGAEVTGSGPSTQPGIMITPRLIARLEINYTDGSTTAIVSDPSFRTKHGPTVTDNWYAGTDYDARATQPGWDEPGADLSATAGWQSASITSPPSLDTKLVWRQAPPVRVQKVFHAVTIKHPAANSWTFDLGQNFAGMERLHIPGGILSAGTVVKLIPGETESGTGTVSTASAGSATGIYDTYTASGDPAGETFTPQFIYHGFQYVQVVGLPAGFTPDADTLVGLQTNSDVPSGGDVTTSDPLINTIHSMAEYSIRSNMQSIFTDCPHREKLGWLADMIQSMGAIHSDFDVSAFLRGMERNMAESQQPTGLIPGTAPEFTVFGGGYRDDVNWGGAFILTPYELWKTYGDTTTMNQYYSHMQAYLAFVRAQISGGLLTSGLGDWIAGDTSTPKTATGTYGLYMIVSDLAEMASALGHDADAADYRSLATQLASAFNAAFFNPTTQTYTTAGPNGSTGSQALDALPLAMGIVPDAADQSVLDDLVTRINAYHPNGGGPHISGGEVSLQPIYEVLMNNDRGDVLWNVLKETSEPSYAYFVDQGRTTIPESWDLAGSQNHMILLQIDEWFNAGLGGIRQTPDSTGYDRLIIKPQTVGTLTHVSASRETPHGTVSSAWTRGAHGLTTMHVSIPAGTTATVYVPAANGQSFIPVGGDATPTARVPGYQVFSAGPGSVTFHNGN